MTWETGILTARVEFQCPVPKCSWTHDQTEPNPVLATFVPGDPPRIDVSAAMAAANAVDENALRQHLADHPAADVVRLLFRVVAETGAQLAATPAYDWSAYERTCDPDRQLDGLGDLALFLGGSWSETPGGSSFAGELLKLIAKAQATPERFHPLALAFPREVTAWLVWQQTSPTPTAAELCAALIENDNKRRILRGQADTVRLAPEVWSDLLHAGDPAATGDTDGGLR